MLLPSCWKVAGKVPRLNFDFEKDRWGGVRALCPAAAAAVCDDDVSASLPLFRVSDGAAWVLTMIAADVL